jgi:hypothetical protein
VDFVDSSPSGCLLCGSTTGPGFVVNADRLNCRAHVIELFELVRAMPLFEHERIAGELGGRCLEAAEEREGTPARTGPIRLDEPRAGASGGA